MKILLFGDELDKRFISFLMGKEECDIYIVGEVTELKLIRALKQEVFTITDVSPFRIGKITSFKDVLIVSNKTIKDIELELGNLNINDFYIQYQLIGSNSITTTKDILIKKQVNYEIIRSILKIPDKLLTKIPVEIRNVLDPMQRLQVEIVNDKTNISIQLMNRKFLPIDLYSRVDNDGWLDLSDKYTERVILDRFFVGQLIGIKCIRLPSNILRNCTLSNNQNYYNSILFDRPIDNIFEWKSYITKWKQLDEIGYIYVHSDDDKEKIVKCGIPEMFIKII